MDIKWPSGTGYQVTLIVAIVLLVALALTFKPSSSYEQDRPPRRGIAAVFEVAGRGCLFLMVLALLIAGILQLHPAATEVWRQIPLTLFAFVLFLCGRTLGKSAILFSTHRRMLLVTTDRALWCIALAVFILGLLKGERCFHLERSE